MKTLSVIRLAYGRHGNGYVSDNSYDETIPIRIIH